MKKILKFFLILVAIIFLCLGSLWHFYLKNITINSDKTAMPTTDYVYVEPVEDIDITVDLEEQEYIRVSKYELDEDYDREQAILNQLVINSERVNILIFSHDGVRADTLMMMSFDPNNQKIELISIPRDTFYPVEGYTDTIGKQKINAVYGRGDGLGGSESLKEAVANLFQIPIHYFVKMNYNGAEAIVNSLGGIELYVDRDMLYDDIYSEPELHIDIKEGRQLLNGHMAVNYLRWRKNNGEGGEGDLPRIKRMQRFAKASLKKAVSLKFPAFIQACFSHIYTDIELDLALSYAVKASGQDLQVSSTTMPGSVKGYFYVLDVDLLQEALIEMYSKKSNDT